MVPAPTASPPRGRSALAWAVLLACGAAGCTGARLSPPSVGTPPAYEGAAAADGALPAQALDRWWTLFADPQLTALIEDALVRAPDARTALQRVEESRAARAQTLSRYGLQGNLTGLGQVQHTDQTVGGLGVATGAGGTATGDGSLGGAPGSTGGAGAFLTPGGTLYTGAAQFDVTYELDLFGRRRAARTAADADLAAARFDAEAARAVLARDTATGLFQARGYAIQLADARETARIAGDLARTARLSVRATSSA